MTARSGIIAALICLPIALSGCVRGPMGQPPLPPGASPPRGQEAIYAASPFAPASMRIHPLTRLESDADGPRIVLHLELKDRWGDTTKGLGTLQVFLYEPEMGEAPGIERQTTQWTLDLLDPDLTMAWYDPATRTYRIPLVDPPAWVRRIAAHRPDDPPLRWALRLRATFTTDGPDGRQRILRDELLLSS